MVRAINKVSIFLLVQFALRYGDSYSYITQLSTRLVACGSSCYWG
jgi:hypothetical protein